MRTPHRARRLAMQALCCLDAQGDDAMDLAVDFIRESDEPLDLRHRAEQMLIGAWAFHQQADALLSKRSLHWDLHRMAVVDRNLLRLATWELSVASTPPRVVINEAIRIAKEFSTAQSPRFINGILDTIAREVADGNLADPADRPETP